MGDEADRRIDRVGAAQREVHVAQRARGQLDEPRGEPDRGLGAEIEISGRVRQLRHLLGRGANDALVPVADVDAPQSGERVEQLAPVDVAQVSALARFEDGHAAALVRAQVRHGMDEVLAVEVDQKIFSHAGNLIEPHAIRIAMWSRK
jgi:hypothetical protein